MNDFFSAPDYQAKEASMNTDDEGEKETNKSKPRLNIPEGALVILPMRNRVLFPSMMMPLTVRGPARRHAVEEAVRQQVPIGIVVQRDPNIETSPSTPR